MPRLPFVDSSVISHPTGSTDINVCLWDLGEYQDQAVGFSGLIDPDWIKEQLAMTMISIGQNRTKVWAKIDLAKVCILYMASNLKYNLCLQ